MNWSLAIACGIIAGLLATGGCDGKPVAPPISIAQIQRIDSGSIRFNARDETIVVTVVDKFGDSNSYILNHEGLTRTEAIGLLEKKRAALQAAK